MATGGRALQKSEAGKPERAAPSREEQTRRRAYEIWLEHGGRHGFDLADWLQAEREIGQEEQDMLDPEQPER